MNHRLLTALLLLVAFHAAQAQKTIKGFVIDSASFAPLPYVSVVVKNTYRGLSTDSKGGFTIPTKRGDTIVFSLVGYNELVFSAAELEETVIIRLAERVKELQGVTIIGHKDKTVPAFHIDRNKNAPNWNSGINLGYFSKLEKEKRKLVRVKAEQERVRSYVTVVCSPEVRERICADFSITEDEYFSLLAEFNIKNQNVSREFTSAEWVTELRKFYADNVFRK